MKWPLLYSVCCNGMASGKTSLARQLLWRYVVAISFCTLAPTNTSRPLLRNSILQLMVVGDSRTGKCLRSTSISLSSSGRPLRR